MSVNIYNSATGQLTPVAGRESGGVRQGNVMNLEEITEASAFSPKDVPSAEALKTVNSNLSVYSTSEKRIGTWIDGKPLYQKTWTGTMSADNSQTVEITFTSSYANPKNMYGNFAKADNSSINGIPFSNNTYYVYINVNEYGLKLEKNNTSWEGRKYDITIQYTKPTD